MLTVVLMKLYPGVLEAAVQPSHGGEKKKEKENLFACDHTATVSPCDAYFLLVSLSDGCRHKEHGPGWGFWKHSLQLLSSGTRDSLETFNLALPAWKTISQH